VQRETIPLSDVIRWLGPPDKAWGDATAGQVVYFTKIQNIPPEDEAAYMFDVSESKVIDFGTITRFKPNALRPDGKTIFNVLDEMEPFNYTAFRQGIPT